MQIIGDVFNIILFVSVIGGAFTILSLLANRVLRFTMPLWFSICGMAAYIIPLLAPGLYLIPPEEHAWRDFYYIICTVWFCGTIFKGTTKNYVKANQCAKKQNKKRRKGKQLIYRQTLGLLRSLRKVHARTVCDDCSDRS